MAKAVRVGAEWAADVIVVVGRRGSGAEWAAGAITVVGRRGSGTGIMVSSSGLLPASVPGGVSVAR